MCGQVSRNGGILVAALLLGLWTCGCGSRHPATAPVSGTVTYQGVPLANATIILQPEAGKSAYGKVVDGQIVEVTTFRSGDGAVLGGHQIAIQAFEANPNDDMAAGKSLIPKKYADPQTSGLTAEIAARNANTLQFELVD